jgi:electron-transferring-flavoprotein dehydrogenase
VRWLGEKAEESGVEIFPGISAQEILYSEDGKNVNGVATGDVGVAKDGSPKVLLLIISRQEAFNHSTLQDSFERGMELRAKQVYCPLLISFLRLRCTILAEGCRGHLSRQMISKVILWLKMPIKSNLQFNLSEGKDTMTYGIGLKEVWEVDPSKHQPGSFILWEFY